MTSYGPPIPWATEVVRPRNTLPAIYRFKQHLCYLLLKKHRTARQCRQPIPHLLTAIDHLRQAYGFRNFENYRLRVKVLCG